MRDEDPGKNEEYRHTLVDCWNPKYCPNVFISAYGYNSDDDSPANLWAQPKLFAYVQRDYKVRQAAGGMTFYNAAMSVFDHNLGSAGHASTELTQHYTGSSPIDEDGFFMSYRGEEDGYVETRTPEGEAVDMRDRPYTPSGAPPTAASSGWRSAEPATGPGRRPPPSVH